MNINVSKREFGRIKTVKKQSDFIIYLMNGEVDKAFFSKIEGITYFVY